MSATRSSRRHSTPATRKVCASLPSVRSCAPTCVSIASSNLEALRRFDAAFVLRQHRFATIGAGRHMTDANGYPTDLEAHITLDDQRRIHPCPSASAIWRLSAAATNLSRAHL